MEKYLQFFIWLPLLGFVITLFVPRKREGIISGIAMLVTGVLLSGLLGFLVAWLLKDAPILDKKHFTLFESGSIRIAIDFYFDRITAVFALVGAILTFFVVIFSKFYLHRDEGFKRYFTTLMLFLAGYNIIIFSGNFETLFLGWELLGICSFLLIAFYRERYLPVRNSLKVISVFRLGDICLILAMWMSHHIWHENITFIKYNDASLLAIHFQEHLGPGIFVALMISIAAFVKSAQLPFSSWLPRAMEGPTSSSAIFYGSLSVHIGVFLLLRTYPYWESLWEVKVLIIATGILTSLVAGGIARVQSTVKTQIAYSAIAQIGIIFVEVALGLHWLALLHFAGNAMLRSYQLLVSPSVLGYRIHDMFFHWKPRRIKKESGWVSKWKNTFYILSLKEWNLDFLMERILWSPFKWSGKQLEFLKNKISLVILSALFVSGLVLFMSPGTLPEVFGEYSTYLFGFGGLIFILKAFSEKGDALWAWTFAVLGQLFLALSVSIVNHQFDFYHLSMFLGGSLFSAVVGYVCLLKIKSIDNNIELNRFHGYIFDRPILGFVFLLACLGFVGLPLTPTFIGIDLLFSHIHKHEEWVIIFAALIFMIMEISVLRIYSRIFLGQNKKGASAKAYRSS